MAERKRSKRELVRVCKTYLAAELRGHLAQPPGALDHDPEAALHWEEVCRWAAARIEPKGPPNV